MTKFNVGDKVRIIRQVKDDCTINAKIGGVAVITGKFDGRMYPVEYNGGTFGYLTPGSIEPVGNRDTSARLAEAEAKIATLEAEVEALKAEMKPEKRPTFVLDTSIKSISLKSPNQRRADVIKRAQAFVADLTERAVSRRWNTDGNGLFNNSTTKLTFHVNPEKGVVTALAHGHYCGKLLGRAFANCAPGDVFNATIGKAIAAGRLYGVDIPKEFTDAPKPTEVVVGMHVELMGCWRPYTDVVVPAGRCVREGISVRYFNGNSPGLLRQILDDTDAVYE